MGGPYKADARSMPMDFAVSRSKNRSNKNMSSPDPHHNFTSDMRCLPSNPTEQLLQSIVSCCTWSMSFLLDVSSGGKMTDMLENELRHVFSDPSDYVKPLTHVSTLGAFSSWKTLARHRHCGAVRVKGGTTISAISECLWSAQTTGAMFSLKHARLRRDRHGHFVLLSS